MTSASKQDFEFYQSALQYAKNGLKEGGIPIGAALVIDGKLMSLGRNQRIQKGSVIHHGEMNCLEHAGRLKAADYKRATMYTTLSPCSMCSGAILLYGIARVVVGENKSFLGEEDFLRSRGVEVIVLNDAETERMMGRFIENNPSIWNEDIGV
jgi:creatinine deaminase